MIEIKDKIIAFKRNGELVIFESRADFETTDLKEADINLLFASPSDLYRRLLELEEVKESVETEREEEAKEEEGEVSENAIRAIRAKEDERQRKILERGEDNDVD